MFMNNLKSCSIYDIYVYANENKFDEQEPLRVDTFQLAPGAIRNLHNATDNPTNVTIEWDPPEENDNCVYGYTVYWEQLQDNTTKTSYIIENLEPCVTYEIKVCVIDVDGKEGNCEQISVRMAVDTPTNILDPSTQFTSDGLTIIEWQAPSYAAKCVIYYRYLATVNNAVVVERQTEETKVEIHNLTACEIHEMQVIPVNEYLVDGLIERFVFETGSKIPNPPSTPSLITRTKSILFLNSEYIDENNSCVLFYGKFLCRELDNLNGTVSF